MTKKAAAAPVLPDPVLAEATEFIAGTVDGKEVTIPRVYLPNGRYLYLAQGIPNIRQAVAKLAGDSVYYILAAYRAPLKKGEWAQPVPTIFRVVHCIIGESVTIAQQTDLGLDNIAPMAWLTMPKIPTQLLTKMDAFFRRVDTDLRGSEAIVILTYDSRIDDPTGWGIVVPEQENNGGHCRYDQSTVMDDPIFDAVDEYGIPYVKMVGTAHSHPGMSAFASHTDEADQRSFDGLHITFGWPHRATEYHIEMQLGGQAWTFKPDQVFEAIPEPPDFPEVKDWLGKVKKETPKARGWHDSGAWYGGYGDKDDTWAQRCDGTEFHLPIGCPNPSENYIIAETYTPHALNCPVCMLSLKADALKYRRCHACLSFIALQGETLEDLIALRRTHNLDTSILEGHPEDPTKNVVFWHKFGEDKAYSKPWVEVIYTATEDVAKKV